ncbi:MAG: PorT family protein [Bacteroidetes bacterium]|nr:PorT family protein [Bacteroidota bacterium]
MKKLLSIFLFTFFIANANAQFYFGPQAGIGVATLNETEFNVNSKFAYHGGLMFNIPFTHHLSVMTGALYSSKGFKYDYVTATRSTVQNGQAVDSVLIDVGIKGDATLGYLDIPIMLTLYFGDQGGFFIQAGPQYSYLLTSTATVTTSTTYSVVSGTSTPPAPAQTETNLEFNKSDLALVGGIGYKLPSFLLVYARATTGFMKVIDDKFASDENAGKNFVIEVGVGLTLGGK